MGARASSSSAPPSSSRRRQAGGSARGPRAAQAPELAARDLAFGQMVRVARGDDPEICLRRLAIAVQEVPLPDVEMGLEMLVRPERGDREGVVRRALAEEQLDQRIGPGLVRDL